MALYYVPKLQLVWVEIKKNATRSILKALLPKPAYELHKPNDCQRIAMWRDPFERIASAYRMFVQIEAATPSAMWIPHNVGDRDFSQFVIDVCNNGLKAGDPHVDPQCRVLDGPTKIVRWDFREFGRLFDCVLGHEGPGDHSIATEWTDPALKCFADIYARDIEIWESKEDAACF